MLNTQSSSASSTFPKPTFPTAKTIPVPATPLINTSNIGKIYQTTLPDSKPAGGVLPADSPLNMPKPSALPAPAAIPAPHSMQSAVAALSVGSNVSSLIQEQPTIIRPNSAEAAAVKNAANAKNKKPGIQPKMLFIAGLMILGILGLSTGIWLVSQQQDTRQQAYSGSGTFEAPSPSPILLAYNVTPTPLPTATPVPTPTATPLLLAMLTCGQPCTSNNQCPSNHVCSTENGYRCVLSACLESGAVCDATGCTLANTPLGSLGRGGTTSTPTPTPVPTATPKVSTPSATTTPLSTVTTRTVTPPKTQPVPVSGSVGTTMGLLVAGAFFVLAGVWQYWKKRSAENDF